MVKLPAEVYNEIFRLLNQKDLQTCYYVCKSWYSIAIKVNWEEVTLKNAKIDLVKSYFNDFNYDQYFKHGYLVRKLTIKDVDSFSQLARCTTTCEDIKSQYNFSKQELLNLLNQFPNLNEIDLKDATYFKEYLRFLLEANLQHISKIETGRLNNLIGREYPHDLYFLVCYKNRDSISWMSLSYRQHAYTFNSQQINVFQSLTEFKKLTELEFRNIRDADLTPFHVQNNCPNLKYLEFSSNYSISDSIMLRLLDQSSKINLKFIASLRILFLKLPSLSTTYTRYLVDYLPNQIIDFSILISGQTIFYWIDIAGMELASRFMEKISKIEKPYIEFETSDRSEELEDNESRPTKLFKLLDAFRRTPQTYCTVSFWGYYADDEHLGTGYSFKYDNDGTLSMEYDIYDDDYIGPFISLDLPDKTSSIIGPEVFDNVGFNMSGVKKEVVENTLRYSLSNFTNAQSFYSLIHKSLFGDEAFYLHYSYKAGLISSDSTNNDVNYLEIADLSPVQCYLDLVSAHLFNIESIVLRTEDWDGLDNDSVIDLTSFKNLKTFTNDIITGRSEEYDTDFILVKHMNEEENYYYLDEEKNKNAKAEYSKNPTAPHLTIFYDASVSFDFRRY